MKKIISVVCGAFLLGACTPQTESIDVHLHKRAGAMREYGSMMSFREKDTTTINGIMLPDVKVAPHDLTDVTYYYGNTSFPQALYQSYRKGIISKEDCMQYFNTWGTIDTLDFSTEPLKVFVVAAIGMNAKNEKCIVFDGNANLDFTDDEPMLYHRQHPVPLYHERYIGGKVIPDTTYVYTSERGGNMSLKAAEWVEQKITLKGREYRITIDNMGMDYSEHTSLTFATPYHAFHYKPGQYAVLENSFYLIDSLSADGRYVHLTEVPDAADREAMQKGFRACSFAATDVEGRTMHFPDDFKGKYVLLDFWSTTCSPCVYDIKNEYLPLYEKYHEAGFEIVGIADDNSDAIHRFKERTGLPWITIADRDYGNELLKRFGIRAFPTLYLIGPDGKVIAEDNSIRMQLESVLSQYLKVD